MSERRVGNVAGAHADRIRPVHVPLLAIGVLGASMSGPLMAAATAVPALVIAFYRCGLGAVVMAVVGMANSSAELRRLSRRDRVRCCFAGLMLAGHFATWTTALKLTSVASATALVCLQVAWVVVLARLAGTRAVAPVWMGLAIAFAGVLVVSGVDFTVSARALGGDGLALLGGAFGAVYITVGGRVRLAVSTTTYTLLCYATSALVLVIAALAAREPLSGFPAKDWGLIVAVTFASQLLGHSVFNYLVATISPTLVSLTLLLEVPGAALLAAVFLGQAPPVAVYAGLALICAGLAIVIRARAAASVSAEPPLD